MSDTIIVCCECGEEIVENGQGLNSCTGCRQIEGETKEITIEEYERLQ